MNRFISIVIPNYNGSKTISLCLEAIYSSTYKNFEVIVVDDGSTDNSIEVIRKFDCKLEELKENRGPSFARNTGAKIAMGEILLFTDSDVCLPKDTLKKINDTFNMEKDISAVVGMPDKFCKFKNIASQYFNLRVHFNYLKMPTYISILYGSICSVKKEAFFNVNGFNTKLKKAGVEDNDLGYRLTEQGYKIRLNKNIQINHYKYLSILKLVKSDFLRASDRVKLMLRKRKFKETFEQKRFISTPITQIYSAVSIPLIFLSLIGLFYSVYTIFFALFLLLLFYFFNRDYLSFIKKEKSLLFSLMIYFLLLVDMSIVNFGIASGLISYIGGHRY